MERKEAPFFGLGNRVPVTIYFEDGETREGTVFALDPRQSKGPYPQPRGLFLSGAVIGRDEIREVLTDGWMGVMEYIKNSSGGGL